MTDAPPPRPEIILRAPTTNDAERLLAFEHATAADEVLQGLDQASPMPLEERREWLTALDADTFVLLAEQQGKIKGILECRVREQPRLKSHVGRFYISIARELWGQGVGSRMLQKMLDWANTVDGLEKVTLTVLANNERAIGLYQKFGFTEEGRKRREYQLSDGEYTDEVLMALFLVR